MKTLTKWEYVTFDVESSRDLECSFFDPDEDAALRRITTFLGDDRVVTVNRIDRQIVIPFVLSFNRIKSFDIRVVGYRKYEKIKYHFDTGFRVSKESCLVLGILGLVAAACILFS